MCVCVCVCGVNKKRLIYAHTRVSTNDCLVLTLVMLTL